MRSHKLNLLAISVLASAFCAAQGLPKLKPGFNLFSKQQDIELGQAAATEVVQQLQIVPDPEMKSYLERIGRKLASQPQAADFPYSFTLVHEKSINAFALPGGPTFVHRGLILAADNEAQLAGVMAHEISHVALRHGTNQASKALGVQLLAGLLGGAVPGESVWGQLSKLGIALGANSVLLKYSRTAEQQADLLGAQVMAGAGYNPIEMARFFEKLQGQPGGRGLQFFSDHPNPGNRVQSVESITRYLPKRAYDADTGQFARIKARVGRLPEPPKPPPAKSK